MNFTHRDATALGASLLNLCTCFAKAGRVKQERIALNMGYL